MQRLAGRVAVVTGAASGIGRALAMQLARHGLKVAALDINLDRLQKVADECKTYEGQLRIYECNICIESDIESTVERIVEDVGPISILVNCAGWSKSMALTDPESGSCRKIYETNVIGLVTLSQHVVGVMKKHDIRDGHVININSVGGHSIFSRYNMSNYCASKHAVTVLTECLRTELAVMNFNTRVTSISPGFVLTEMSAKHLELNRESSRLSVDELIECIMFILQLNPNINISEMTVQAVKELL